MIKIDWKRERTEYCNALTGKFLSSCILYLLKNAGLPVRSTKRNIMLARVYIKRLYTVVTEEEKEWKEKSDKRDEERIKNKEKGKWKGGRG